MKREYQNYHKHTCWSNIFTPDSTATIEDYVKRTLELGNRVISSVEHGWQGHYYKVYEAVQNANKELEKRRKKGESNVPENLKFVFGTEAYWVKNRYEKDNANNHIIILARNEEGRREINDILSEASISGYYYKPRVDLELLLSLNPENVFLTSACIGFYHYDDVEDIIVQLHNHFKDNFCLELQYHNTEKQKQANKYILSISKKYDIDIIMGCDSHYIKEDDSKERNNLLNAKDIFYEEEDGWLMDYPTYDECVERFKIQGVLSDEEIYRAIENTNLILDFDDITFDKEIKLPTLYPDKSQEWKDKLLIKLVHETWTKDYLPYVRKEDIPIYNEGIVNELKTIIDTKMTDYFLMDYEIVKRGKERGGIISKTARGSGGSFFVNTLLGFSNLDRFQSPVKLYPERFMSKTRILKTKSLPDLDLNLGTVEIFADVQKELLGENHAYPMIAFGTLKTSSAFKMYCRSQGVDFELANEISKQIQKYEKALKQADSEEDKEMINLYDYVDIKFKPHIEESKKYQGIIDSKSKAPCGYLLYQGDIRREIGLIKCKSESTKKEYITTVIDGYVAEEYKFVKNDLLKVDVANTIKEIYDSIGREQDDIRQLTELIYKDDKTWDIYAKGYTLGVNQMESNFGVQCCKKYKPRNVAEVTALVSALRPGFKSMLNTFLNRKEYTTGVSTLDSLLEDSFHFIMYQENIMTYLGWLGIEQTETYAIIKKISKKKFKDKELKELKSTLLTAWIKNTGNENGFEESFHVVEDFSKYAFNASHAYAYAYDSLYGAYLKSHYPYDFYSVMLQTYTDKGKKDKVSEYKKEMKEAFGIEEGVYKFRRDNRKFTKDEEHNCINPSLSCIKGMGVSVANKLYELKDNVYNSFLELYSDIKANNVCNDSQLATLIKIDYFDEFGKSKYLLDLIELYNKINDKKQFKKDSLPCDIELVRKYSNKETEKIFKELDSKGLLYELASTIENKNISIKDRFETEIKSFGYISYKDSSFGQRTCVVTEIKENKWGTVFVTLYKINNGNSMTLKVDKKYYTNKPLSEYEMIRVVSIDEKHKRRIINGKWTNTDEKEYILSSYNRIISEVENI